MAFSISKVPKNSYFNPRSARHLPFSTGTKRNAMPENVNPNVEVDNRLWTVIKLVSSFLPGFGLGAFMQKQGYLGKVANDEEQAVHSTTPTEHHERAVHNAAEKEHDESAVHNAAEKEHDERAVHNTAEKERHIPMPPV